MSRFELAPPVSKVYEVQSTVAEDVLKPIDGEVDDLVGHLIIHVSAVQRKISQGDARLSRATLEGQLVELRQMIADLRDPAYIQSLTPEQLQFLHQRYNSAVAEANESVAVRP